MPFYLFKKNSKKQKSVFHRKLKRSKNCHGKYYFTLIFTMFLNILANNNFIDYRLSLILFFLSKFFKLVNFSWIKNQQSSISYVIYCFTLQSTLYMQIGSVFKTEYMFKVENYMIS